MISLKFNINVSWEMNWGDWTTFILYLSKNKGKVVKIYLIKKKKVSVKIQYTAHKSEQI